LFSQFIAAAFSSNSGPVQLEEEAPIVEENNENKEQDSVNNSDRDYLNSSDSKIQMATMMVNNHVQFVTSVLRMLVSIWQIKETKFI
jgi:hypothetical protein